MLKSHVEPLHLGETRKCPAGSLSLGGFLFLSPGGECSTVQAQRRWGLGPASQKGLLGGNLGSVQ